MPAAYLHQYLDNGGYAVTYQASDHFLVLSLGPVIVGVDRIERRARWVRSLLPADLPPNAQLSPGGADGSIAVQLRQPRLQRLGLLGPIGPNGVYVQTRAGVASLDLATGDLRWLRTDSALMLDAFGDEQHLYLVESHAAGDVRAVRAVRTADGVAVSIPDCVDVYNHRLRTLGRCVLASNLGPADGVDLRLYDVRTGQDVWKRTLPGPFPRAGIGRPRTDRRRRPGRDRDGRGPGRPEGTGAAGRRSEAPGQDHPRHPVAGPHAILFGVAGPADVATNVVGDPSPNISGSVKWTEVSGMIYAFDRTTGALNWNSKALSQSLLLDHFEESPVLLLTPCNSARSRRPRPAPRCR